MSNKLLILRSSYGDYFCRSRNTFSQSLDYLTTGLWLVKLLKMKVQYEEHQTMTWTCLFDIFLLVVCDPRLTFSNEPWTMTWSSWSGADRMESLPESLPDLIRDWFGKDCLNLRFVTGHYLDLGWNQLNESIRQLVFHFSNPDLG